MDEIKIRITKKDIDKSDPTAWRGLTPLGRALARDYPEHWCASRDGAVRLQAKGGDEHVRACHRGYDFAKRDDDLVFPFDDTLTKFMAAWWRGAKVNPLATTLQRNAYVTMVAKAGNKP